MSIWHDLMRVHRMPSHCLCVIKIPLLAFFVYGRGMLLSQHMLLIIDGSSNAMLPWRTIEHNFCKFHKPHQ